MNTIEATLNLTRPAKSKGGDRYEGILVEGENPIAIYLPQSITRSNSTTPLSKIIMKLNTVE